MCCLADVFMRMRDTYTHTHTHTHTCTHTNTMQVLEDGKVCVHFFGEQPSRTFDVLVGADGLYSGVRRQRLAR